MPPRIMRSSVRSTITCAVGSPLRSPKRRRNSWTMGCGNLMLEPKPPHSASMCGARRLKATSSTAGVRSSSSPAKAAFVAQVLDDLVGGGDDLVAALVVGVGRRLQHTAEAGDAAPVLRRVVGAAVKRLQVRGQEDAHGPAAGATDGDHGVHVDGVQVRAFLAVNLDADEEAVHDLRDSRVLERLALHDVAPVARGVADAEEDGLVLAGGQIEGLGPPRVPVNGVVGVLLQVGARFRCQSIGHTSSWGTF